MPRSSASATCTNRRVSRPRNCWPWIAPIATTARRSEEHTSELQSRLHPVCRLLLEKKNDRAQMAAEDPPAQLLHAVLLGQEAAGGVCHPTGLVGDLQAGHPPAPPSVAPT